MSISVIIATMNRPEDVKAALESLAIQTRMPDEILIIDQSPDGLTKRVTEEMSAVASLKKRLHYYFQGEKSLVKARNRGLSLAKGDILSFLDDDIVLFADYFERILDAWKKYPDAAGISGNTQVKNPMDGWRWPFRRFLNHFFLVNHYGGRMTLSGLGYPITEKTINSVCFVEMLPGCNMNFKKTAVGNEKFDEWFQGYSYREDAEFSYRISKKGRLLMVPDAKLFHNYSTVSRLSEAQLKSMAIKNEIYVVKKFKGKGFFASFILAYSFSGMAVMDFFEFLFKRTQDKKEKFKAGLRGIRGIFEKS